MYHLDIRINKFKFLVYLVSLTLFSYLIIIFSFHHLITNLLYKEWLLYNMTNRSYLKSHLTVPSLTETINMTLFYHLYMLVRILTNTTRIITPEEINKKDCLLALQQTGLLINLSLKQLVIS